MALSMIEADPRHPPGASFDAAHFVLLCLVLFADAWYLLKDLGASIPAAVRWGGLERTVVGVTVFLAGRPIPMQSRTP